MLYPDVRLWAESFGIPCDMDLMNLRDDESYCEGNSNWQIAVLVQEPVLCRQAHFIEKFDVSPVVAQVIE